MTTYTDTLSQGLTTAGSSLIVCDVTLTQSQVIHTSPPVAIYKCLKSLSQSLTVSLSDSEVFRWGRIVSDILRISQAQAQQATYNVLRTDTLRLAHAMRFAFPVVLTQGVSIQQIDVAATGLVVLQRLGLTGSLDQNLWYHLTLAQALILDEALQRFFSAEVDESMTASHTGSYSYSAYPVLAQAIDILPALSTAIVLRLDNAIDLTPDQVINAIYQGDPLLDGIRLTGLYVNPNGTVTTWAINTRTNAITEYMNYGFSSFAQTGRKFIATDAFGVYELDGSDDDGADIIAEIQSALMRFNSTKLAGLKGAYLAVRGGGEFFLKIITGDAREYVYQVVAQPDLMTTKINIGKGMKATYYAFNLVSTGQDFNLDGLEFVPMMSGRRI